MFDIGDKVFIIETSNVGVISSLIGNNKYVINVIEYNIEDTEGYIWPSLEYSRVCMTYEILPFSEGVELLYG